MKYRFIGMSGTDNGIPIEYIVITDDLKSSASDWLERDMEIYEDKTFEAKFPVMFPVNNTFQRLF